MAEIKCPHCNKVFQVDESGYAAILSQVKDAEFHKELERREKELLESQKKDAEIIRQQEEKKRVELLSAKDKELLAASAKTKELEDRLALLEKEAELKQKDSLAEATERIRQLENALKMVEERGKNALELAESKAKQEIDNLQNKLASAEKDAALQRQKDKETFETLLSQKDEEIERYRDYKLKMSTKMIGESLEQYCENKFNENRMMAFPRAYFEKDNDASSGSKGDFIFRDYDEDGAEIISIMFEMKNEADATETKHKNEDFFKKLDKDRNEKKCEYAVLVSMLEADNDFYNNGICDVSYKYPKMYVIRPQFFIPIISLLRNGATRSLEYRRKLVAMESQSLDVKTFEENLKTFQEKFDKDFNRASARFTDAIEQLDKTINGLQKVRDFLVGSTDSLRKANDKAQALTIKSLTKNAPAIAALFEEAKKDDGKK